ncbi:MAG: redoxin family protein [Halobacteriovoraceae bacterium]|nr:redoxin family protein [Halobacteriovoraceae bacterium]
MNLKILILLAFLISCVDKQAEFAKNFTFKKATPNFTLFDLDNNAYRLHERKDAPLIALFVYSEGCPIAQQQVEYIEGLNKKYSKGEVEFRFLISDKVIDKAELRKNLEKFHITIPVLLDSAQSVAHVLDYERTAEVILLETQNYNVVYRGQINDRFDYGSQKVRTANHYLVDAIESYFSNELPKVTLTEPKGCMINVRRQKDISFNEQIVPILKNNCIQCHHQGGRGPWAMDSHHKMTKWASMVKEVIVTKRMPPRYVVSEVSTLKSKHLKGLSPEDEFTLLEWINQGAKNNEKERDDLKVAHQKQVKSKEDWPLGEPDLIVSIDKPIHVIANGYTPWEFRYLKDKTLMKKDRWLKAFHIKPMNEQVTHHLSLWTSWTDKENQIRTVYNPKKLSWRNNPIIKQMIKDETFDWKSDLGQMIRQNKETLIGDEMPGPTLKDSMIDRFQMVASYSPGKPTRTFPPGLGRLITKGSTFRFINHYKPAGYTTEDKPRIGLYFYTDEEAQNVKPVKFQFIQGNYFVLPKHQKSNLTLYHVVEKDMDLYAVAPHLHYRGRSQKVFVQKPGQKNPELVYHAPNFQYDANSWENYFTEPIFIPKGSVIISTAEMDNTQYNPYNPDPSTDQIFDYQLNKPMFWVSIAFVER